MIKVDFHTHSNASPDGGITPGQYQKIIKLEGLDFIAITDHNRMDMAVELFLILGECIIVGEEIETTDGELIGLFIKQFIAPNQSPKKTAEDIKEQGGLVYVPHPFETVRKGISEAALDKIADLVDIVETANGRAVFQNRGAQAAKWAKSRGKAMAASSDAHGYKGLGTTFTQLNKAPSSDNLVSQLSKAELISNRPPLHTLLNPKMNRLKKRVGKRT